MAGQFDKEYPEWNVKVDVLASKNMVNLCPVPMIFLPFEVGEGMITGGRLIKNGDTNPVASSLINMPFGDVVQNGGRHSWDPATAIYAIEGAKDFFEKTTNGTVTVKDNGETTFTPSANGLHKILYLKPKIGCNQQDLKDIVAKYIDDCMDAI